MGKIKDVDKKLEKIYEKLDIVEGGDWYILNTKQIDKIFEDVMDYAGAFNKETEEFLDGDNWSELASDLMTIFWQWYINILKTKLNITRYYEKYHGKNKNRFKRLRRKQ